VRPDGYVAWRSVSQLGQEEMKRELTAALARVSCANL
jgi:hypothetical protein